MPSGLTSLLIPRPAPLSTVYSLLELSVRGAVERLPTEGVPRSVDRHCAPFAAVSSIQCCYSTDQHIVSMTAGRIALRINSCRGCVAISFESMLITCARR